MHKKRAKTQTLWCHISNMRHLLRPLARSRAHAIAMNKWVLPVMLFIYFFFFFEELLFFSLSLSFSVWFGCLALWSQPRNFIETDKHVRREYFLPLFSIPGLYSWKSVRCWIVIRLILYIWCIDFVLRREDSSVPSSFVNWYDLCWMSARDCFLCFVLFANKTSAWRSFMSVWVRPRNLNWWPHPKLCAFFLSLSRSLAWSC